MNASHIRMTQHLLRVLVLLSVLILGVGKVRAQTSDLFVCCHTSGNIAKISGTDQSVCVFVPAGTLGLEHPDGIAFGPDGNLYVSSPTINSVLCFNGQTGAPIRIFASNVGGGGGWTGDLAWGPDGDLYVLHVGDSGVGSLERYAPDGTLKEPLISGVFSNPRGISFGPAGDIYISAEFSMVRHYLGDGRYVGDVLGIPNPHKLTFGTDGDIYVCAYAWPPNNPGSVEKYNGRTFGWEAEITAPVPGSMTGAVGVALDPLGNIYVGSADTSTVHMFSSSGTHLSTNADPLLSGADELVFRPTSSVTLPPATELIVGTQFNDAVLSFDGNSGAFNKPIARSGQGVLPMGVTLGPDNDLYVSSADHTIYRFDHVTGASHIFASSVHEGDLCYANGKFYLLYQDAAAGGHMDKFGLDGSFLGETSLSSVPSINTPRGVTVDDNGVLYISCLDVDGGAIIRYYPDTNTCDRLVSFGSTYPHKCFYHDGVIYSTVWNGYVLRVTTSGEIMSSGSNSNSIYAYPNNTGVGNAHSVAVSPSGKLVVSSYYNNELMTFDLVTGLPLGSFASDHFNGLQEPAYFIFRSNVTDALPPDVGITPNDSTWRNSDVPVTITASDESGGSGLKQIEYTVNGVAQPTSSNSPVHFTMSMEGANSVNATAIDNAGNRKSTSSTVYIDKTRPHTSALMSAAGKNVTVTLSATDPKPAGVLQVSGIATTYYTVNGVTSPYTVPFTVAPNTTVTFWSIDKAGNIESANTQAALITVTVLLTDSHSNPLAGGAAQYLSGVWKTIGTTGVDGTITAAIAPGTYAFAITYKGGRIQKNQDIGSNPTVSFQTTAVTVRLQDSLGNPLSGGTAQFFAGSWQDIGVTGSDGTTSTELLPYSYAFSMTFGGGRIQKNQDISATTLVVFQTVRTTIKLIDSSGNPLVGGTAQYYAGSWRDIGVTGADGTATIDLLPNNIAFAMTFAGGRFQKNQDTSVNQMVVFQTSRVHSGSGTCTQYYGGGWRTFTNDIELLPATYLFKFGDGTANTNYTVSGTVTNIH